MLRHAHSAGGNPSNPSLALDHTLRRVAAPRFIGLQTVLPRTDRDIATREAERIGARAARDLSQTDAVLGSVAAIPACRRSTRAADVGDVKKRLT